MSQRPFVGRLPYLNLAIAPARPQEPRNLVSREPSLARLPPRRQGDSDDATVQSFLGMMADCCGKVLKVAPCATVGSAPFGIGSAIGAGDFAQAALAKELKDSSAALGGLLGAGLTRRHVGEIDVDHVGHWNLGYVAFAARRCVFVGDVLGERRFSLSTFAHAAASAALVSGVFDDPDCALGTLGALTGLAEP